MNHKANGAVRDDDANVIVVGAGPSGATTAYYLAQAGLSVLLVDKARFPRAKVCGDGMSPRAVKALVAMGVDVSQEAGWRRTRGVRVIGSGMRLELPWPELSSYPGYGLIRSRASLDEMLARRSQAAGAKLLEGVTVTGPVLDDRGVIKGVRTRAGRGGSERTLLAPIVVAADGNSARLAVSMGLARRDDRPLGVAVRTYYTSPRHDDDHLEIWADLWNGDRLLPGYGWIFGMGDGTSNVGLGLLNTTAAFGHTDYQSLLRRWLASVPEEWGFTEENRTEPVRGAALPMAFNRTPHYYRGLLLAGDAAGMVNPFNGEGIAYAMESGEILARVIAQAAARPTERERERVLRGYPVALRQAYGGYFTLGRLFARLAGQPQIARFTARHGTPRPALMRFTLKLLANLTDPTDGDAADRVINALTRLAPVPR